MSTGPEVRVAVAIGRDLVRAGMAALIDGREGIVLAGSFGSSAALRAETRGIDVVVLDPLLGEGRDLVANAAHARALGAGTLALVDVATEPLLAAIEAAGVGGVVLHTASRRALVEAVLGAAHRSVLRAPERLRSTDAGLSAGERQVLALYAAGVKADAVARAVSLSASTVTTYVSRIRRKYERAGRAASSRVDLYRRAVEDGVLPVAAGLADAG